MIDREDERKLRSIIADQLDLKIEEIAKRRFKEVNEEVEKKLDNLSEKFDKLEKIDRILSDLKSLFS